MKGSLAHLQVNVSDPGFYQDLLTFLGWRLIDRWGEGFGATDGWSSLWIFEIGSGFTSQPFHRKATGLNHLAFRVGSRGEVDDFHRTYLLLRGVPVLYGGPREYPEYGRGYYATYFEDPVRIKLEVFHRPEPAGATDLMPGWQRMKV